MNLERIILDDFLTYDHLDYKFEKRPLQVQGLNLTDDIQKSCGSGKSGIPTAIEYCMTASNSRGVRDNELITYGKKSAEVQLYASCDVRKEVFHIDWIINAKGSNLLALEKKAYDSEDWEKITFSNLNDGKKAITDWFAISKEDLFNYYIINNTRFKSFFKSSNTEKVNLINRFSDASIVDGIENINTDDLQNDLRKTEDSISGIDGSISTLSSQLETEKNRDFKAEKKEAVEEIEEKIKGVEKNIRLNEGWQEDIPVRLEDKDVEINKIKEKIEKIALNKADISKEFTEMGNNISKVEKELKQAEKVKTSFVPTDWEVKRSSHKAKLTSDEELLESERSKKDKLEKQETKLASFLSQLEVKLSGTITCPKCNHKFLLDGNIEEVKNKKSQALALKPSLEKSGLLIENTIELVKKRISILEGNISSVNKEEQKENEEKNLLTTAVNKINEKLTTIQRKSYRLEAELKDCDSQKASFEVKIEELESKKRAIKDEEKTYVVKIKSLKNDIEKYKEEIKNLELGNNKQRIAEINTDLRKARAEKIDLEKKVQKIKDKIYEKNTWIVNFKQFRLFLANQSLVSIQYHINRFLQSMNSDMQVRLDGFKLRADATTKEEITATIIRENERTFDSFSGGEKGILLFAAILANRYLINETNPYGGLNFLSIDEVLDTVDSLGINFLIESAKKIKIPMLLITHVTDEEIGNDTLLIVKENKISRIKNKGE